MKIDVHEYLYNLIYLVLNSFVEVLVQNPKYIYNTWQLKNNDKYIVTNEIIMNKQNLWYMNMYICISTPNEIFISCFGTINEIFRTGININKIYGTSFNFIKFLEQVLIHVLMRILEQVLNFMKIYVTGINIKRAGWSWSF